MPQHWDAWLRSIASRARSVIVRADWYLVALVLGFVAVALWIVSARAIAPDASGRYREAVAAAALKRHDFNRPLTTVELPVVRVVTLRTPRQLDLEKRQDEIWVVLKDQLREACRGSRKPLRKIQEVLGLPPADSSERVVSEIEVRSADLVRPCIGGGAVHETMCASQISSLPPDNSDAETLRKEYYRLWVVARQMWTSYRVRPAGAKQDATGRDGYPFTGMGSTYNWSVGAPDRVGLSEFIIRRDATIKLIGDAKPADFCKAR